MLKILVEYFKQSIRLLLLFILLNLNQILLGQNRVIDSLKLLLDNCSTDTSRVFLLTTIGSEYYNLFDIQKALNYAQQGLSLAEEINYKKGIAKNCLSLGGIYSDLGKYHDAEIYDMRALVLYKEMQNKMNIGAIELNLAEIKMNQGKYAEALSHANSSKEAYSKFKIEKDLGDLENFIGLIYYHWGKFPEALQVFSAALEKINSVRDSIVMADIYLNMGNIYIEQGNVPKAMENYIFAKKIYESKHDKVNIAKSYGSIGDLYKWQNDTTEALNYYNKALNIGKSTGAKDVISIVLEHMGTMEMDNKNYSAAMNHFKECLKLNEEMDARLGISTVLEHIGELNAIQGHYNEALSFYRQSYDITKEIEDQLGVASLCNHLGKLYLELNHLDSAEMYFLQVLPIAHNLKAFNYIKDAEMGLYKISMAKNDYQAALDHYKYYSESYDSFFNAQQSKQLAEVKGKFESELKDRQIKLQSLELGTQKRTKNYLIAFSSLFVIISFLIYREYYNKQHLKLQNLRNKIASDLHDDVGSTLSSISIFSQIAQRRPSEVQPLLQTIEESSKKMLDAMADIVWTIKPENDQFEKIILRMRSFSYELLGAKQIQYRFIVDEKVGKINISMESRRNLYLIFKEATNNMVKYSNATKAEFSLKEDPGRLIMKIQDNGIGFDQSSEYEGNGLKNMHARAMEIGASLSVNSSIGNGTHIQLILEI